MLFSVGQAFLLRFNVCILGDAWIDINYIFI